MKQYSSTVVSFLFFFFLVFGGFPVAYASPLTGDITNDGRVNAFDLSAFFLRSPVNIFLYAAIVGEYGAVAPTNTSIPTVWLDSAWSHRLSVQVRNNALVALSGHQVRVTVPYTAPMRGDFADLRITASDKLTQLPFWVETVRSGVSADLWVRVPSIAAGGTTTLYAYYGNAQATSVSDGTATFDFFESFSQPFGTALSNASSYLTTPTYDGSGQAVHPDVAYFPNGWRGWKYWMAVTPYANSNDQLENPSILVSQDGTNWSVPPGLTNPIYPTSTCDHNNDTDIVYNDETDELWVYFLDTRRAGRCAGHESQPYYNHNYVMLLRSSDGIHWSAPEVVVDWNLSTNPLHVSPAVVKSGGQWFMWTVRTDIATYAYQGVTIQFSSDGRTWGNPRDVAIGEKMWHLDVLRHPQTGDFWMLTSYPSNSGLLRFYTSTGSAWVSYPGAVMLPQPNTWNEGLYRSSMVWDAATNRLKIWYSARTDAGTWQVGYGEESYPTFLNALQTLGGWTKVAGDGALATSSEQQYRDSRSAKFIQTAGTSASFSKPISPGTNMVMEWDMYDDLDPVSLKVVRLLDGAGAPIGVGVWTGAAPATYAYHNKTYGYTVTSVPRTQGWHAFGLTVLPDASNIVSIDGTTVGQLTGQMSSAAQVNFGGSKDATTTYYVDDIRIRKYVSQPPTVQLGTVELY